MHCFGSRRSSCSNSHAPSPPFSAASTKRARVLDSRVRAVLNLAFSLFCRVFSYGDISATAQNTGELTVAVRAHALQAFACLLFSSD
eukprot:2782825-Pleurochrysis_carterae.AAC.3